MDADELEKLEKLYSFAEEATGQLLECLVGLRDKSHTGVHRSKLEIATENLLSRVCQIHIALQSTSRLDKNSVHKLLKDLELLCSVCCPGNAQGSCPCD